MTGVLEQAQDICAVQKLLVHRDVHTTMSPPNVLSRPGLYADTVKPVVRTFVSLVDPMVNGRSAA